MRVIVVSFGTPDWAGSLEALRHSALRHGADEVWLYGPDDVASFFARNAHLDRTARGHGHWAWKPWVIADALKRADADDLVVWCDAGMVITASLRPLARGGFVTLPVLGGWPVENYGNREWTKPSALRRLDPNGTATDETQVNAAFQAYRVGPFAAAFVDAWLQACLLPGVIDDSSAGPEDDAFFAAGKRHRHDQSVLSLLAHTFVLAPKAVSLVRDVTQFGVDDPKRTIDLGQVVHHHRRRLDLPRVAVITSTVGGPFLGECLRSVQATTLPNVEHWVVVDGAQHEAAVRAAIRDAVRGEGDPSKTPVPVHVLVLPRNVGADGWNGHRAYGAVPWLVDADHVAFLDDDNVVDPDHYRDLLAALVDADAAWAYSLRRIVDADGTPVCDDNCESLGGIRHVVDGGPGDYLVDTSCYLIDRELAVTTSGAWNARFRDPEGRPEPDRELCKRLLSSAPHAVSRRHSVAYRVGSTSRSVAADFFTRGNDRLGYDFARRTDVYVFHFSPKATADYLEGRRSSSGASSRALDEWQMTLLRGLDERYNLLDGYACAPNIPPGAVVLVDVCLPGQVPWDFLKKRTDLWRIGATWESPNIRHATQWSPVLLASCFDVVLTYAKFLLDDHRVTTLFCPHNTHHLDLDDPRDVALLRENRGPGRSVVMVLERRDLSGTYVVPDTSPTVELEAMDSWRPALMKNLRDATVYGVGWGDVVAANPGLRLGHALHRSEDPRSAVDIVADHDFVVIVENCLVDWYASEKFYDALIAGAIPLYMGRLPPALDVPEGVESGVYVDLGRVLAGVAKEDASAALQSFLDGLDDATIAAMKDRIVRLREGILRKVGTDAFATSVEAALDLRPRRKAA